ncbi:uncharacterized protein LOC143264080 [Megachile rotundata]|uniref:uncharacterized protein LOC143264080 n=1 Tax=Megachile rotundata TaxID=143995 RepID=UPI003FD6549E
MSRRAGKKVLLRNLKAKMKKNLSQEESTNKWKLIEIDIPDPPFKEYKQIDNLQDPRRKYWKSLWLFGRGAVSPRNNEDNCRCTRCIISKFVNQKSLEDKRPT